MRRYWWILALVLVVCAGCVGHESIPAEFDSMDVALTELDEAVTGFEEAAADLEKMVGGLTKPQLCSHCGATGWIDDTHLAPAAMAGQRTASGCRACGYDGIVGLEICRDCGEVLPHKPTSLQERAHKVVFSWGAATAEEKERYHDWGRRKHAATWKNEPRFTENEIDVMAAGGLRPLRDWSTHWSTPKEATQ